MWGKTSSRLSQEKGLCRFILLTPKKNCNYPNFRMPAICFSPHTHHSHDPLNSPSHLCIAPPSIRQAGYENPYCTYANCSCSANKHRHRPLGMSTGYFKQAPTTKIRVAMGIRFRLTLSNSESINLYQTLYILSKNIYSIKTIW